MTGGLLFMLIIIYLILDGGVTRPAGELGNFGTAAAIIFWALVLTITIRVALWAAKIQERKDNAGRIDRYKRDWE